MADARCKFEIFDHTADMGFCAVAPTKPGLLEMAGEALYACIGELPTCGRRETMQIELSDPDPANLLRDYLNELLILFERQSRRVVSLRVAEFSDSHLSATIVSELVDSERSVYDHEVKAITYHELAIRPIEGGFEATVIVDI